MAPESSIIIRTKNEEKWIGRVLEKLFSQTYKNFEVLIVDSGSKDKTLQICQQFPLKIERILPEEFSYPYALNYGVARARARKYVVIISGHSLPVSDTWLTDGLGAFNLGENILGVYGYTKALPGSTLYDFYYHNIKWYWSGYLKRPSRFSVVSSGGMGVMGFTNAIIRKDLWEKRKFNEEYGAGGEDGEWAGYWMGKGYVAIRDRKFTVYHSHSLSFKEWQSQFKHWSSLGKPQPFRPLSFRKDPAHNS